MHSGTTQAISYDVVEKEELLDICDQSRELEQTEKRSCRQDAS